MAARKTVLMAVMIANLLLFVSVYICAANNLHHEAALCRQNFKVERMNPECLSVCVECHEAEPIQALDIYADGDTYICVRCHESKTSIAVNNLLLNLVQSAGGNHRVQIFYDPGLASTELHDNPRGPKLYVDNHGEFPKVHCSTCHNPMSDEPRLLRINNRGSRLCLACHDK